MSNLLPSTRDPWCGRHCCCCCCCRQFYNKSYSRINHHPVLAGDVCMNPQTRCHHLAMRISPSRQTELHKLQIWGHMKAKKDICQWHKTCITGENINMWVIWITCINTQKLTTCRGESTRPNLFMDWSWDCQATSSSRM